MKIIKVTLDYGYTGNPMDPKKYKVVKITGDCLVEVKSKSYHIDELMGEDEAKELCVDSRYEVTVIPKKYT